MSYDSDSSNNWAEATAAFRFSVLLPLAACLRGKSSGQQFGNQDKPLLNDTFFPLASTRRNLLIASRCNTMPPGFAVIGWHRKFLLTFFADL
ncbi:MAG: hypothetical protein IT211_14385 [Armatimonadetes bacterium]|nr:hypothetical protein [Armatimonadota bacterium]